MWLNYCGVQGYYRRGTAYLGLGKFQAALKDFRQVFVSTPTHLFVHRPFLKLVVGTDDICLYSSTLILITHDRVQSTEVEIVRRVVGNFED